MSRVAVIGGGTSGEHDVSVGSAAAVVVALGEAGHDAVALTVGRDGEWRDHDDRPIGLAGAVRALQACDVAIPMVHGPGGEDGTLAALCALAAVPCAGTPVIGGAIAMDKWVTKLVARELGIGVTPGVLLTRATAGDLRFTEPVVVKPVCAGSSLGVTLVRDAADLSAALEAAFAHDDRVLVEQLVEAREIDVAVLGRGDGSRLVAPALEIVGEGVFDHETKYDGSACFLVPAPLQPAEEAQLQRAALAMYDALGCRGVVRIDFFLTADGPVLNEVNTTPGFTAASQAPRMFAAAGLPYAALLDAMVADALHAASPVDAHLVDALVDAKG